VIENVHDLETFSALPSSESLPTFAPGPRTTRSDYRVFTGWRCSSRNAPMPGSWATTPSSPSSRNSPRCVRDSRPWSCGAGGLIRISTLSSYGRTRWLHWSTAFQRARARRLSDLGDARHSAEVRQMQSPGRRL